MEPGLNSIFQRGASKQLELRVRRVNNGKNELLHWRSRCLGDQLRAGKCNNQL